MTPDRAAAYAARLATGWVTRFGDHRIVRLPGTLASIDLSGFTRLSERLALYDSAGAETLNATINDQFRPLIEIALRFGGDILQFGGDALLIWFEGEDHAKRACVAARNMQSRIAENGRVVTPLGPVRLRMSVGVATGTFTFAVIGHSHRELIVLGEDATTTVELESRANAGEILVSDATAAELPRGATTSVAAGAWKLRRTVQVAEIELPPPDEGAALAFVPPEMRPILAAGSVTAEHRHVTVAFVKVPGTDVLTQVGREIEALAVLDRVADTADEAVHQFGVCWSATDIAPDGFKLLFFAGAPITQEDDAGRVLGTARLFVDRCSDLGLQIGVNTGRAFAADVGHPQRRTFAILGDTVNLAARLMGKSQPSRPLTVVASTASSRVGWSCGPPQLISVKGKRQPVSAVELLGEARERVLSNTGFAGRDETLAVLCALLAPCADRGTSVEIVGEAGVGKSVLVERLLEVAAADGFDIVVAQAAPFRSQSAYEAFGSCFPALLSSVADAADELDADELVARRDHHHAQVVASILTKPRRSVVVIEDVQWLDEASTAFLGQLIAAADRLPWLIVLTHRPDDEPLPADHRVTLEGLSLDVLLAAHRPPSGGGWLDDDLDRLQRAVRGNPMLFAEGLQLPPDSVGEIRAGRGGELFAQRLDRLDPGTRWMVRVLAVAGRPLTRQLLHILAEVPETADEVWTDFEGLLHAGPDGYWFTHEALVAVAYAGMARRDRRRVHGLAAEEFERRQQDLGVSAAELAGHYFHSGAGSQTIYWSQVAAAQARRVGALRAAANLLQYAFDLLSDTGELADGEAAGLELAELDIALGRFDHADATLRQSWEKHRLEPSARNLVLRARAAQQAGRFVAARRFLRRAEIAPTVDPADRVDAVLLDALVIYNMGRTDASVTRSWQGLLAAKRLGDNRRRAQAHLQLEMARWASGHVDANRHQAAAEALFRELKDAKGLGYLLMNRGVNRMNEGPWPLALADCEEASAVLDAAGFLIDGAIAAMNACVILVRQGHGGEARRRAEKIERIFHGLGWPEGIAYLQLPLAADEGQRGEISSALRRLATAEEVFARTHNLEFLGETHRQRAICLLYQRRADEAIASLAAIDPAWFELDPALEVGTNWLGGHAAMQTGSLRCAGEMLHCAERVAAARRLPYDRARVAWSLEAWAELCGSNEQAEWRALRRRLFAELGVTDAMPALPR